jgi:hypothetical protein
MRPIDPAAGLVLEALLMNQRAPSGPAVMPAGTTMLGSVYVVTVPLVVIRPMAPAPARPVVNHSAPSGPAAIQSAEPMQMPVKNVKGIVPLAVVSRPIDPEPVNHSAPSGPATIPKGRDSPAAA